MTTTPWVTPPFLAASAANLFLLSCSLKLLIAPVASSDALLSAFGLPTPLPLSKLLVLSTLPRGVASAVTSGWGVGRDEREGEEVETEFARDGEFVERLRSDDEDERVGCTTG